MKKLFVVSDVHGFYDELIEGLRAAGFDVNNPDHIFVSLGDLLDRGKKPIECLTFVKDMYDRGRAILIKGNHEDLMEQIIIDRRPIKNYDISNGTIDTICAIGGSQSIVDARDNARENELLNWYLKASCNYYKLIGRNLFIHSTIPNIDGETFSLYDENSWEVAIWQNPIDEWRMVLSICENGMVKFEDTVYGKYNVYCGHRAAVIANLTVDYEGEPINKEIPEVLGKEQYKTFHGKGINILDGCTMISGIVNCEVIEIEDKEWHDAVQIQKE